MPVITDELIRRKAEHHDGLLTDLEELSLHQCAIERITTLSTTRKLRILYLQSNIIPRIEGLYHLKDLRYLNLALNNIQKVEGLGSCEFLNKLDLTVNFVDVDELESSAEHLAPLLYLRELFLMGNPVAEWSGYRPFLAAMLPQLAQLDGKEITKAERISAMQSLPALRRELRTLADAKRREKGLAAEARPEPTDEEREADEDAVEAWTPEARVRMVMEQEKKRVEQEQRRGEMEPKKRDHAKEQVNSVENVRAKERALTGPPRQINEGRWEFHLDDDDGKGNVVLRLSLSKYMDSSLIDCDVHPTFVSIVIKSKLFRLLWPEEVLAADGTCQRSQTTGELVVTVPKVRRGRVIAGAAKEKAVAARVAAPVATTTTRASAAAASKARPRKLADELAEAAGAALDEIPSGDGGRTMFREVHTRSLGGAATTSASAAPAAEADDDELPPLE